MTDIVRIEPRWEQDALALHIGHQVDGYCTLYGPGGLTGIATSINLADANSVPVDYKPALVIRDHTAQELLRALLTYFGGADDTRNLRRDYDAERDRVDKLVDAIVGIAAGSSDE